MSEQVARELARQAKETYWDEDKLTALLARALAACALREARWWAPIVNRRKPSWREAADEREAALERAAEEKL